MSRLQDRALAGAAFLLGLGAGAWLLYTFGFLEVWRTNLPGGDFSAIWAGPRLLVSGGDPYDPASFRGAALALGVQQPAASVYLYPGWVALLLAPFGLLDLGTAARLWIVLGVVVAAAGLFVLLDAVAPRLPLAHTLLAFMLLGSEPAIVAFFSGQADHLVLGLVALGVAWLATGRPALAGVAAGGMLLKPQLFLLAAPALLLVALARGQRRFVWSLAATAVALAVASVAVLPRWPLAWLTQVAAARAADPAAASLPNAMADTFGTAGTAGAYVALAATIAASVAFAARSRATPAVWLATSLAVAPYIFVYDHIVAIVPLAVVVGLRGQRRVRDGVLVAMAGALAMCVAATLLHATIGAQRGTLSFNGFVLYALTLLVVAGAWPLRREAPESASALPGGMPSAT